MGEHRVINAPTDDPARRRFFQCTHVLIAVEGNNRKPLPDIACKKDCLLTTDAMFAGHPRQGGVHFGQAVRSAAARSFIELNKQLHTGAVVNMIPVEYRPRHRLIQKTVHSALPRFDRSRSARICWSISSVAEAGRGCPERNTQTPCSLVSGPVPRKGRSMICSPAHSIS